MLTTMRKYQPLWEKIKFDAPTPVSVAAEPDLHRRIINAVIKEKTKDLGWKLLMTESGKKYKLQYDTAGNIILFYLIEDTSVSTDINSF